jgi:hypothetical protein
VAQEHIVAAPNGTYQSFPKIPLRSLDTMESPISRIRPVQEAMDAIMQVLRKTVVPYIPDAQLSHVYKYLMQDAVPRKSRSLNFYTSHLGPFNRNPLGRYIQAFQISSRVTDARMIRMSSVARLFLEEVSVENTWNPEFTALMVFESNNCVLYFFLLDEPVIIENCRYRFVYGTE